MQQRILALGASLIASVLVAQDQTRMKQMLDYLASRELLGRESGQAGCVKAATYLAGKMQAMGLKTLSGTGMGGETPFHYNYTLSSYYLAVASEGALTLGSLRLEPGVNYRALGRQAQTGDSVFLGYGLPEDFVGKSIQGKWALVLEGHSGMTSMKEEFREEATLEAKVHAAKAAGALGLILLEASHPAGRGPEYWNRVSGYSGRKTLMSDFPVLLIQEETSRLLDRDLLQREAESPALLRQSLPSPRLQVPTLATGPAMLASTSSNIVGLIPGTDSTLKSEYLLVTGHYDHLGGTSSSYYPGADDNASGTVGVMELAQLLANTQPKRSILFVAFSGEEKGLLGSEAFAAKCPVDLTKVVGVVNMDMIGRNATRTLYVTPAAVSNQVNTLVKKARELVLSKDLDLSKGIDQYWQQSDHYSFAKRGIPVIFLNTGDHADLHRTTDTADKIDYVKMVRIVDLAKDLVLYFANSTEKPVKLSSTEYNAWSWPVKGNVTSTFSITTQPVPVTVTQGQTATFKVAVTGGKSPYTYQWYRNGSAISGATGASYSLVTQNADQGALFKAVIKDAAGLSLTSNEAKLTVGPIIDNFSLILNGGFESGNTNWSGSTGVIGNWSSQGQPAYEGTYAAYLGGNGKTSTETLYQAVTIPANSTSANLSFYLHIDTKESGSTAYDKLAVQVRNSSGTVLKTLATYSNANKAAGYQLRSFDLSAYKGQTIRVHFNMTEDSSLATNFLVDKVSLIAQ